MTRSGAPLIVDGSGIVEVGSTIVSVHRRPLTHASLDAFDVVTARVRGPHSSFGVYRLERVRPGDFADVTVRDRIVRMGNDPELQQGVVVLDGPGFTNAAIRLALAGVLMLIPGRRTFDVVGSVDEGIAAATRVAPVDGPGIKAAVALLVQRLWDDEATAVHAAAAGR